MTKDELIQALTKLKDSNDPEKAHVEADGLLLKWIDDEEIEDAFEDVPKFYA